MSSYSSRYGQTKMWRPSSLVNFVPVTHPKPGLGSGNIPARNDPEWLPQPLSILRWSVGLSVTADTCDLAFVTVVQLVKHRNFYSLVCRFDSDHTSAMRPKEHRTNPDNGAARAQASGCQRGSCASVRRGRRGTGIASDGVRWRVRIRPPQVVWVRTG